MASLLIRGGGEEPIRGVRGNDGAAEYGIGDEPVNVDGHPRGVGQRVPHGHPIG